MKNQLLISLLLIVSIYTAQSQINILRYNDNFSILKKDTVKNGLDKFKEIKIRDQTFISFGGELREQFQYFDNQNFGDGPPGTKKTDVGQIWQRIMVHGNIEVGKKVRAFLQVSSTFRFFNPNPLTPEIDENQLSLHQVFVDYNFSKKFLVRAGRQELDYGNSRLIGVREGPNTRLTFDAVVLKYASEKTTIDLIVATPVISRQKLFDDKSFEDALSGIYATTNVVPKKLLLDYYFIHFKTDRRKYNYIAGEEKRQIFGGRMFSRNARLNYELEGNYQTGSFNESGINAYSVVADLNYKLSPKNNFVIGIGCGYITGDKDRADNKLNTYNPLFSKPQYGLAAPIGSANIETFNPYIRISPVKKATVFASVFFIKRQSNQDGTYTPGGEQIRPNRNNLYIAESKDIGTQYVVETAYALTKNISFFVDGTFFKAGNYIKQTGIGKHLTYLSFKATFKF
ncbi:MAG: alginate export family protein [Ferruginibacter sp.]|nr:alginate export family protein [Ferruginibacter sp.]